MVRGIKVGLATIHEEDVHPAVVVVVKEGDAWADGLGEMPEVGATGGVDPVNTALGRINDGEFWRGRGLGGLRRKRSERNGETQ